MALEVKDGGERGILIRGIDPVMAHCLRRVPEILAQRDSTSVRERLYPDARPGEPARGEEWRRLVGPELRHLFEAAAETYRTDLAAFDERRGEIAFPAEHRAAWMSAINQARLVLAEMHQLTEADLSRTELGPVSMREVALLEVQALGYLLHLLVEHAGDS